MNRGLKVLICFMLANAFFMLAAVAAIFSISCSAAVAMTSLVSYGYTVPYNVAESVLTVENKDMVLTYYCPCSACCGSNTGVTALGTKATPNHTIAAPQNIPFGTMVFDSETDNLYTVEDRGGAIKGNKLDVFVNTHAEALQKGIECKTITLVKVKDEYKSVWTEKRIKELLNEL